MASGINDTFRQVGIAVGTAVWGALLVSRGAETVDDLTARSPGGGLGDPGRLVEAASSGSLEQALTMVAPPARDALGRAASQGFLTGLNTTLVLGAAVAGAGALLALWLIRDRDIRRDAPHATALNPRTDGAHPPAPAADMEALHARLSQTWAGGIAAYQAAVDQQADKIR
jgi:hypothetical protein